MVSLAISIWLGLHDQMWISSWWADPECDSIAGGYMTLLHCCFVSPVHHCSLYKPYCLFGRFHCTFQYYKETCRSLRDGSVPSKPVYKYVVFSTIGTYLQILRSNQGNDNSLYDLESFLDSPDQHFNRGFSWLGLGFVLDTICLVGNIPIVSGKNLFKK